MNFSLFNRSYNSIKQEKPEITRTYDAYDFKMYDNTKPNVTFSDENAQMATKGIMCEDDLNPIITLFFSKENIKRIQRMIKKEILDRTQGKYLLETDQNEADLVIVMRAVLFDANVGGKYLPFKIKHQVKKLNFHVVQYIVPDMIENIKQYYGYLREINQPLQPMMRPVNVNAAGRKMLPSIMTMYQK